MSSRNFQVKLTGERSGKSPKEKLELTPREQDVMKLLVDGATNKEISIALGITVGTAKVYVSHVFQKSKTKAKDPRSPRTRMRMQAVKDHLESLPHPDCSRCVFKGFVGWAHAVSQQLLAAEK